MTDVYAAGRGAGKTHDLVLRLTDDPKAVLICSSRQSADHAKHMARLLGFENLDSVLDRIMTTADLSRIRGKLVHPNMVLLVDNAEVLLSYYLGYPIAAISVTGEAVQTSATHGFVTQ